ncbi:MAG: hypothetical protein MN733_36620 [Nitrososphaera sp.]|nr:hypothetical protein [Nitrososphaera sp.]
MPNTNINESNNFRTAIACAMGASLSLGSPKRITRLPVLVQYTLYICSFNGKKWKVRRAKPRDLKRGARLHFLTR